MKYDEVFTLANKQEIFDHVVKTLVAQGGPATRRPGSLYGSMVCAYRGDDGKVCAVGAIIRSEVYSSRMETAGTLGGLAEFMGCDSDPMFAENYDFLREMQIVHDDSRTRGVLADELRCVARKYGLVPEIVDLITPDTYATPWRTHP